jgi:bifunctional non-homologous end joining protein LigD
MKKSAMLKVGAAEIEVSNLDKVLYPATGFTKGQMIDYYVKISPWLLPHLKNRPITLKRYPDGVTGFFFYEKKCPEHHPEWVRTTDVPKKDGGEIRYCLMNDLPALVWAANLADIELHTFLHRAPAISRPTAMAFDLDPGAPADILDCCKVGLRIRDLLADFGLESFPKTSGSKGLQVYMPINGPITYERTKAFAHAIAELLESETPAQVVSRMQKNLRKGKVFVDWSQNDQKKTTVNVYSLRAKERPTVSTPVTWDEVESAARRKKGLSFETDEVLDRVARLGDLFEPVLSLKQKLPALKELTRKK